MFFNVESGPQIGADAGEAGGCIFVVKNKKKILKNDKKEKYSAY